MHEDKVFASKAQQERRLVPHERGKYRYRYRYVDRVIDIVQLFRCCILNQKYFHIKLYYWKQ